MKSLQQIVFINQTHYSTDSTCEGFHLILNAAVSLKASQVVQETFMNKQHWENQGAQQTGWGRTFWGVLKQVIKRYNFSSHWALLNLSSGNPKAQEEHMLDTGDTDRRLINHKPFTPFISSWEAKLWTELCEIRSWFLIGCIWIYIAQIQSGWLKMNRGS